MGKRDVNEIITGKMRAQELGVSGHKALIQKIFDQLSQASSLIIDLHIDEVDLARPVEAIIDFGRWGAVCECGGAEYVDPDEPVFYCFSCGNEVSGGKLRPVQFPADREDIELLLVERPISVHKGITKSSVALNSQPLKGLYRNWHPGEDISKLKKENKDKGLLDDPKKIKEKFK